MQISNNLLTKWTGLRSVGDTSEIAENAGVTLQTVRNAFKDGKCSEDLFKEISKFYKAKSARLKQYI